MPLSDNMDVFVEQIVKKKKDFTDYLIITAACFLALVILFGIFIYLFFFLPLAAVGLGYGLYYLINSRHVEFEYSVTNGDIDIDRIVGKKKRQRIVSVSGSKIEAFGRLTGDFDAGKFDRRVMAAPSPFEEGLLYFSYRSKKRGNTLVIFMPGDRIVKALNEGLRRDLRMTVQENM